MQRAGASPDRRSPNVLRADGGPNRGPDESDWQWRLSIAEIAQDGAFSAYPATRRQFVPLDAPVTLQFAQRELVLLRLAVAQFDGDDAPHAQLPEGPTRAFNLMLRGDAQGELMARPLNGSMWLPPGRWFVHMLSGHADIRAGNEQLDVAMGANLWIDAPIGQRTLIQGGGELILVQLSKDTA